MVHKAGRQGSEGRPKRRPKRFARGVYYFHRWLGVAGTAVLVIICITGILLNHKRPLGLMPEVPNEPSGAFSDAMGLSELAGIAAAAVDSAIVAAGIDRMDARPADGLVKVRYKDRRVTEVTLDINTGELLAIGERNDQFLEKLHSGQIFGDLWVLVTDAGAIFLLGVMVSGYWLWLYPKSRV